MGTVINMSTINMKDSRTEVLTQRELIFREVCKEKFLEDVFEKLASRRS